MSRSVSLSDGWLPAPERIETRGSQRGWTLAPWRAAAALPPRSVCVGRGAMGACPSAHSSPGAGVASSVRGRRA
eukprot:13603933-Alexandrium_andersonii.AAC.1